MDDVIYVYGCKFRLKSRNTKQTRKIGKFIITLDLLSYIILHCVLAVHPFLLKN